ncbi:MAG: hypothetical protein MHM6MM_003075 [Cercozoa sp. M6MM]
MANGQKRLSRAGKRVLSKLPCTRLDTSAIDIDTNCPEATTPLINLSRLDSSEREDPRVYFELGDDDAAAWKALRAQEARIRAREHRLALARAEAEAQEEARALAEAAAQARAEARAAHLAEQRRQSARQAAAKRAKYLKLWQAFADRQNYPHPCGMEACDAFGFFHSFF